MENVRDDVWIQDQPLDEETQLIRLAIKYDCIFKEVDDLWDQVSNSCIEYLE